MASLYFIFLITIVYFQTAITFQNYEFKKLSASAMQSRIINGRPAQPGEFPYQLQLRLRTVNGTTHLCGAALATSPQTKSQIVLTAAHCVTLPNRTTVVPPINFLVRAGTRGSNQPVGQTLSIRRIIVHPNWTPANATNDIAVLILNGNFSINKNVTPIALPKQDQPTTGNVTITGWGLTNSSGSHASGVLRVAQLPVIDNPSCNAFFKEKFGATSDVIPETNICAGLGSNGQNVCFGDSGGPVVGKSNGKRYLAGLVSFVPNRRCEAPDNLSVSTRVSSYVNWINQVSQK